MESKRTQADGGLRSSSGTLCTRFHVSFFGKIVIPLSLLIAIIVLKKLLIQVLFGPTVMGFKGKLEYD